VDDCIWTKKHPSIILKSPGFVPGGRGPIGRAVDVCALPCFSPVRYDPSKQRLRTQAEERIAEIQAKMIKKNYMLGLASGVVLAASWKFLVKEGVKVGVKVGRGIKKVSAETLEDIEDASAEAMHDLEEEENAARESERQDAGRRRKRPTPTV